MSRDPRIFHVGCRCTEAEWRLVQRIAKDNKTTVSRIIRALIREWEACE